MAYIGPLPAETFTSFATQEFSTSATTSYTLDHPVTNENELALFINNVRQQPGSGKAYTASGTALTLSAATASTDTMYAVFLGRALQTVNPADSSVGASQVADNLISGKTALAATPADTDELLISDAGTLKRIDYSYLKGNLVKLSSATASNSANITFDSSVITSTYKYYQIHCIDVVIQTDGNNVVMTISTDNGSSYISSNYSFLHNVSDTGTSSNAVVTRYASSESLIPVFGITNGMGNSGNEQGFGIIELLNPHSAKAKLFRYNSTYLNNNGELTENVGHAMYNTTSAVNNIKLAPGSGNITSGSFILYGVAS
jgi:hypothetical protein